MRLPAEATSLEGFISLTVQLVSHGYYFWVRGDVRNNRGLSPQEIDCRMIEKFRANLPKYQRPRERKKGHASVRYVRYGQDWFLFSTYGASSFFESHGSKQVGQPPQFHDIRNEDRGVIRFHGYEIRLTKRGFEKKSAEEKASYQQQRSAVQETGGDYRTIPTGRRHERWVCRVTIGRERYLQLRDELVGMATHRTADFLKSRFYNAPFLPYKPVQQQLKNILRQVNKARRHAFGPNYEPVPTDAIRFHNPQVSPYRSVEAKALSTQPPPSPHPTATTPRSIA